MKIMKTNETEKVKISTCTTVRDFGLLQMGIACIQNSSSSHLCMYSLAARPSLVDNHGN